MAHASAPDVPITLFGSKPGVFDLTQPSRLLRYPDSTLLFASFNPPFSSGTLSADRLSRASRVVVEVPPANDFIERPNWFSFVPKAVLAPGVASEGKWPRLVDYCGRWVICDQDQWDIHKLDPAYDCFVPTIGMHPTITRKIDAQFTVSGTQSRPGKREFSSEDDQPTPNARKGADSSLEEQRSGNDLNDPGVPKGETTSTTSAASAPSGGLASLGGPANLLSRESWMYLMSLASSPTLDSSSRPIPSSFTTSISPVSGATNRLPKRFKAMPSSSSACHRDTSATAPGPTQPVLQRPAPPASAFSASGFAASGFDACAFAASAPEAAPMSALIPQSPPRTPSPENAKPDDDAEAVGLVSVMESPLQIAAPGVAHQATSAQIVPQDTPADESRRPQAVADAGARDQDIYAPLGPQIRRRGEWAPWSPRQAIDRYMAMSRQFDNARFSLENPVKPSFIPWPVLVFSSSFQVAQLCRWMVEAFFEEARLHMRPEDYRTFVVESLKRFHPDRWRNRGVFATHDSELSQALEQASITISQVLSQIRDTLRVTGAQL